MAKLLHKPEELKVTINIEGTPLTVTRNGKAEHVTKIYQQWHTSDRPEATKHYFRVRTNRSHIYDIYRHSMSNLWYLERIYD